MHALGSSRVGKATYNVHESHEEMQRAAGGLEKGRTSVIDIKKTIEYWILQSAVILRYIEGVVLVQLKISPNCNLQVFYTKTHPKTDLESNHVGVLRTDE
jgi:hypothetical protein